ncbi:hypothetical protein [Desulfovibrio gilichinskyi]|uniref:Uncharacterized protein n=1 Tax=Desulfovibrio gilichinskyi TaxID=1519643 RepID=A0A1X7CHD1_9BACT|nr:hypothetical protein [Desulfovibrio gilichinskyi]SME96541.1 hypothetical protein SAMN06295933_0898 [Desulfovibrio gilichinskyi]
MKKKANREKVIKRLSKEKYLFAPLTLFSATFFLVIMGLKQGGGNFLIEASALLFALSLGIFGPLSYVLFFREINFDKKVLFKTEYYKFAYFLMVCGYISVPTAIAMLVLSESLLAGGITVSVFFLIIFISTDVIKDK